MLGSLWAILVSLFGAVVLIIRTSLEDKMLQEELRAIVTMRKTSAGN